MSWVRGKSGNPGGRRPLSASHKAILAKFRERSIEALPEILDTLIAMTRAVESPQCLSAIKTVIGVCALDINATAVETPEQITSEKFQKSVNIEELINLAEAN